VTDHFLDLPGAAVIATDQLLDTRELVAELVEATAMGAIYGPAGTGKTFAVSRALGNHAQRNVVSSTFRSRPTTRYVRHELYRILGLGIAPPSSPVETDLLLKQALGERRWLLVIDEAQWLNRECLEYLRYLHDDRTTTFAMLLVGGAGCYEVIRREPMLDSRLYAHLRFAPLSPDEVAVVIPLFHPIYHDADLRVIALVNEVCAHGNFRNWALFTHHAALVMKRGGLTAFTEEVARNVFGRFGGDRAA
jgi:DNA transposition AAA+ family ATPase